MGKYVLKRLGYGAITLVAISVVVFSLIHLLPSDPISIMFGKNPNPALIERAKAHYDLDKPVVVQYFLWVGKVLKGDLGKSIVSGIPVTELIAPRISRTLLLAILGILFSLFVALPTGIISAARHNTWTDFAVSSISLVIISVPEFWIGIMLTLIFSVWLMLLPTSGYVSPFDNFGQAVSLLLLPAITVASVQAAQTTRMTRATMIDVLRLDYITLMKAMGISNFRLLAVHAFRNALLPVVTLVGLQMGLLMGGVIIVEKVFTYPGLGLLMLKAIDERDYPTVQACLMFFAFFFVLVNIAVDLIYAAINPKIRY
jgi:peptide/nickel transport system permease protein